MTLSGTMTSRKEKRKEGEQLKSFRIKGECRDHSMASPFVSYRNPRKIDWLAQDWKYGKKKNIIYKS